MHNPTEAILLVGHVLSALVGFGAIALTGDAARRAAHHDAPFEDAALIRFFRPSRNWPARTVLLTPLFGGALLALRGGSDPHEPWPWIGLALWAIALGVVSARLWPSERQLQQLFATSGAAPGELRTLARRAEGASLVATACFVGAVVVMIAQPS